MLLQNVLSDHPCRYFWACVWKFVKGKNLKQFLFSILYASCFDLLQSLQEYINNLPFLTSQKFDIIWPNSLCQSDDSEIVSYFYLNLYFRDFKHIFICLLSIPVSILVPLLLHIYFWICLLGPTKVLLFINML